jgi:hypothetical protein
MSTINTVTAREPKLERDSVTFVLISRYFDCFSAAVQKSHARRRCTAHDLARVAGKWLTGAGHREGSWGKANISSNDSEAASSNDQND